jgi:spore coat protein JB
MDTETNGKCSCDERQGCLPHCAPLAAAYVPMHQQNAPRYKSGDALARGTLFPGLDLPWKNIANSGAGPLADTPLGELMALCFVVQELGLYLDTHPQDREALSLYTEYVRMLKQGKETFTERYGPIEQTQVTVKSGYSWIDDPWPWELQACPRKERGED